MNFPIDPVLSVLSQIVKHGSPQRQSPASSPCQPLPAPASRWQSSAPTRCDDSLLASGPRSNSPIESMDRTPIHETDTASSVLLKREHLLAAREADLLARRRETARQLRRSRRESSNVDTRLATIESLLAELAQAVLAKNEPLAQAAGPAKSQINDGGPEASADGSRIDDEMLAELEAMRSEIEQLTAQNEQLANELARASVHRSISKSTDANATMTWEQRKALIFAQDAEDSEATDRTHDTAELRAAIERLRSDVQSRDTELAELRELLEQQPIKCNDGMAIGAAAIANLMESDELLREERSRLQSLQTEWESTFRQMEISASIERANLARERQRLERQNVELEEQLAHLKRELRQEEITGPNQSRRWFAKLGLGD